MIAADGSSIQTLGNGSYSPSKNITLNDVQLSPSIPSPIISLSSLTHDHKKIVVFSDAISCIIDNTLNNQQTLQHLIASSSTVTDPIHIDLDPTDRLFKLPVSIPRDTPVSPIDMSHTPTITPHPPFIHSLHRYSTTQTKTAAEEVDLWHRILGHCDVATLVSMAAPGKVDNFPVHLTPASIRKHFPTACPDCPHGNLQRRPSFYSPSASLSIGEEFELDYKGK